MHKKLLQNTPVFENRKDLEEVRMEAFCLPHCCSIMAARMAPNLPNMASDALSRLLINMQNRPSNLQAPLDH